MRKIFITGFAAFLAACVATPREYAAWNDAISKNTVEAYRAYLEAYPNGFYVKRAYQRLETVLSPAELRELGYAASGTTPVPSVGY